jgi:hypothetical protein
MVTISALALFHYWLLTLIKEGFDCPDRNTRRVMLTMQINFSHQIVVDTSLLAHIEVDASCRHV